MLGKKFGVLMVLALFVFSVIPVAFAQDGNIQGHAKDITEDSHAKDIRDRAIQAQANFGDVKAKIVNNRVEVAKCLVNSGMSGCAELLNQDLNDRKQYLKNAVDRIEAVLDSLEEKAQHINDVTERDEMVAHIKDRRDALHELALKVESVQDRAGLKALRDEFVDLYKDIKQVINQYRVTTRLETLHGVNQKLIALNTRINHIADNLEAKGVTLGEDYPAKYESLQNSVEEIQSKLDIAKEKYQHALELKNSGATQAEVEAALGVAKGYLEQVQERVRNVRDHIQDIIQFFNNRAGSQTLSETIAETA